MQWKDIVLRVVFVLMLFSFGLSAYYSTGFYHADEHWQLLEFANYKTGNLSPELLPWEFEAQIRPTLQVSIAYLMMKVNALLGSTSPHDAVRILRFITLFLFLMTSIRFIRSFFKDSTQQPLLNALMGLSLWFLPFLAVRFSSESWGGIFLIIGWLNLRGNSKWKWGFAAIFFGLSFWFRFQMVFAILPLLFAFFWEERDRRRAVRDFLAGGILILALGITVDRWFYGSWVISPWNYFTLAFLEDSGKDFGTSPWWQYFQWLFEMPYGWVSLPLFLGIVLCLFDRNFRMISIVFLSFLLGHSVIGHKEARFLFPMAIVIVPLFPLVYFKINRLVERLKPIQRVWGLLGFLFITANGVMMGLISTRPVGIGEVCISEFLQEDRDDEAILIYHRYGNPHNPWEGSRPTYLYQKKGLIEVKAESPAEIEAVRSKFSNHLIYYSLRKTHLDPTLQEYLSSHHFEKVKESLPPWQERFNTIYPWMDWGEVIYLFKCKASLVAASAE